VPSVRRRSVGERVRWFDESGRCPVSKAGQSGLPVGVTASTARLASYGTSRLRFAIRHCTCAIISRRHGSPMELRHLSYFVAAAGAGSLTEAAEQGLFTSQPR